MSFFSNGNAFFKPDMLILYCVAKKYFKENNSHKTTLKTELSVI